MHDAGGTKADVLSTPEQQAGAPDVWSPGDTYFPGAAADGWSSWVTTAYSYTYRYRHQTFVWDGFTGTSTGDIVITK